MIPVDDAVATIVGTITRLPSELVHLDEALGRVLADDLVAVLPVPRFDNSAMDGYAVHADVTAAASANMPVVLDVIGESAAGDGAAMVVARKEAARIFTGAPIPKGCDAVVMQENVTRDGGSVRITTPVARNENVRTLGEDIAVGAVLLSSGALMSAGEVAITATQGRNLLPVVRAPRVAIVVTGNELVELDRLVTAAATTIPNSNAVMLAAQVREAGGVPIRAPIVRDEPDAVADALFRAAAIADIVVTSGGVSVGDHDHVASVVAKHGSVTFHKVRMRPGKPVVFGSFAGKPFFGLPGNPVSSFVAFELFVRPALRTMQGADDVMRPTAPAALTAGVSPARDRPSYMRVQLRRDGTQLYATPSARQGAGDLTSLVAAHGLAIIEAGGTQVATGTIVNCLLLRTC